MKKPFSVPLLCTAIFCTAMLCGCSANGGEEISETSAPETSSVTVTTESTAATVTETETTTTITTTNTANETTVTEPAEEKIILTPIPSNETFEVMSCQFTVNGIVDSDENFPDKEVLKRAREICFEDEKIAEDIKRYNDNIDRGIFNPDYGEIKIETADDMEFSCGIAFDFDNDGKDEYVIVLDSAPLDPMNGCCVLFIDGDNYEITARDCGITGLTIISSSGYYFPMITIEGASFEIEDIYSFENNKIKNVLKHIYSDPHSIAYENGIFYLCYKYDYDAKPFILCGDGVFRQFGREKITREDFESHVKNGGEYLDSLAENGDEVAEIYTYGYFNYVFRGEDFQYNVYSPLYGDDKGTFLTQRWDLDWVSNDENRFTDEVIYGDVWAVQKIS